MAKIDKIYHNLLEEILDGYTYLDPNRKKQGVKRKQINKFNFEYDLNDGFPAVTTKKLAWKSVVGELLWILRGDTNIRYLVDNGIPIWNKDSYGYFKYLLKNRYTAETWQEYLETDYNTFIDKVKKGEKFLDYSFGNVGKNYGYQLRHFSNYVDVYNNQGGKENRGFDQLQWLVDTLKNNPMATKKIVTYWNPVEKGETALTPCHRSFEAMVRPLNEYERYNLLDRDTQLKIDLRPSEMTHEKFHTLKLPQYELSLSFDMSSVDTFLGLIFNIASYALTTHILAEMCNMKVGKLYGNLTNVHIYEPHIEAVKEQLKRDVDKYPSPKLFIDETTRMTLSGSKSLDEKLRFIGIKDFQLQNYESYPAIKAKMLAYDS